MVDGGSPEHSAELLKLVAGLSGGKPVQVLFNTCWDTDHTGSNDTLGKAGAKIIAHENTKLWLGAEFDSRWRKRTYEPRPKAALPNQTFYSGTKKMTFGAESVEYGYMMQAHTDGDMYVYFPGPNILMTGGVAGGNCYPVLDFDTGGWFGPLDRGGDARYTDSPVPTGIVGAQRTLLKVTNAATKWSTPSRRRSSTPGTAIRSSSSETRIWGCGGTFTSWVESFNAPLVQSYTLCVRRSRVWSVTGGLRFRTACASRSLLRHLPQPKS